MIDYFVVRNGWLLSDKLIASYKNLNDAISFAKDNREAIAVLKYDEKRNLTTVWRKS